MFDIWLWGVIVSSVLGTYASARALYDINKNDPAFKKYYDERSSFKNTIHFLKSIAKLLIPIFNIGYAFHLFSKLCSIGAKGLKSVWKNKILKNDEELDNAKSILKNTGRIVKAGYKKVTKQQGNVATAVKAQSQNVTNQQNVSAKSNVTSTPTSKFSNTSKVNKPTESKKESTSAGKFASTSKKTTDEVDPYQKLIHDLDSLNASSMPTDELTKYYKQQYWALRSRYDQLKAKGQSTTDIYKRISILHDKCIEMQQLRSNNGNIKRK